MIGLFKGRVVVGIPTPTPPPIVGEEFIGEEADIINLKKKEFYDLAKEIYYHYSKRKFY